VYKLTARSTWPCEMGGTGTRTKPRDAAAEDDGEEDRDGGRLVLGKPPVKTWALSTV
jgi:hypothetical protein